MLFMTVAGGFLLNATDASADNSFSIPDNSLTNGLQKIVLNQAGGKITITLPDAIRPGDRISGTVIAEPAGKTEQERATNSAELSGIVVEIADSKQTPWEKNENGLKAMIQFGLTEGKTASVLLKSKTGAVISNIPLKVQSVSMTMQATSLSTANDYQLPTMGQQDRPVEIMGPFDGNAGNTNVSINGQPCEIIAESPRMVVFKSPMDVTGPTQISIKEGIVGNTGEYRSVGINLTSAKTKLIKGEKTTINVSISGLQGLKSPVPIQLVTTGSANMKGGNAMNIQIAPNQVNANGMFNQKFSLTGTQAGGFNVLASVLPPRTDGDQAQCECKCEAQRSPITQALKRSNKDGGTAYTFAPNFTYKCTGSQCTAEITYTWSIGAGSTATYTIREGTDKKDQLVVDVTGSGTLEISVTATVKCSPGGTCSASGSKTFTVTK